MIDQPYPGGPGNPNDNIRLMHADYNVIEGFRSTDAPRAGIAVRGTANQPILRATVRASKFALRPAHGPARSVSMFRGIPESLRTRHPQWRWICPTPKSPASTAS